jgi:Cyclic nucleotide-binding domain
LVRSTNPAPDKALKPSRLPATKPQSKNGDRVFDPEAFLAKAGVGKKIVTLKKGQLAYAQGDPANTIFYVQKGRLRVSVTSAIGKEAPLSLVGAGEFVGEMKEPGAILVVSHDPHHADVRKHWLVDAGYEVIPAMNIQGVREACERRTLQLVVIGYSLPPAEVRRVRLEVRQGFGVQVPILELRKCEAATLSWICQRNVSGFKSQPETSTPKEIRRPDVATSCDRNLRSALEVGTGALSSGLMICKRSSRQAWGKCAILPKAF